MKESEPSGKVTVTSMDTMALDIYHSPVYHAFTGSNLVISATVTNNVGIKEAKVYYRVKGQAEVEQQEDDERQRQVFCSDRCQIYHCGRP
ncbi:MAG: hypothetical protein V8Q42_13015 [Anaerovoracaceae bacterium]